MSVECYGEPPGKFDSRTLSRKTLSRWIGRSSNLEARAVVRELADAVQDEIHDLLADGSR